ncbi:hypothetical protein NX059_010216 [Plenodomus lindquistii]|nr:hypothetical protein NX059_010216 [Plenodomus lindquistii]
MNICRMVKDEHEVKLIREANDISSHAHKEVLANILKFRNEAQVEGLFMDVCISKQAKEQAYDPIAASGPNAGTLHYDANNEDFEDRQLMCLDAGCEYELYASDVTRTFPLAPSWPTQEAENIYKLVERMQEACIERLAPGVRYLDLHIRAHQIAIDGLLQLGIFHNGTREEIYKAGTSRAFFPHGLGHHIGLEVHDVGQADLMSIRRGKVVTSQTPSLYPQGFHVSVYDPTTCHAPTDPESSHLEAGMIVTVEPGIYFSAYALQQFYLSVPEHAKFIDLEVLERYMPVGGVRIEDDILITSSGYENLTTAPKGDAMFDIIRGKVTPNSGMVRTVDCPRRRSTESAKTLVRAPGFENTAAPVLRSLGRAETMPAAIRHSDTVDFEPFGGPSLYSDFKRSMTTDEKVRERQRDRKEEYARIRAAMVPNKPVTVCGQTSRFVEHTYLSDARDLPKLSSTILLPSRSGKCKDCAILVQTLDRLRQNLQSPKQTPPNPVAGIKFDETKHSKDTASRLFLAQQSNKPQTLPISQDSIRRRNESTTKMMNHQQLPIVAGTVSHRSNGKAAFDQAKELPAESSSQLSIPALHIAYQSAIASLPARSAPPKANPDDERLQTRMSGLHLDDQAPAALPTMRGARAPPNSGVLSPTEQHARATQKRPPPLLSSDERELAWLEYRQADRDRALNASLGIEEERDSVKWNGFW